jgi:hypothetical protein
MQLPRTLQVPRGGLILPFNAISRDRAHWQAIDSGKMIGAVHLSGLLKHSGVPLPAILAEDVRAELPWLVLERLPGTDKGALIARLSEEQLDRVAARVESTQAITAKTGSAGRYGYSALPAQAPYTAWTHVLEANLDRSS